MLRTVMAGTGCLVLHASMAAVAAAAVPSSSPMEDTCGEVLQGDPGPHARKETVPPDGAWVAPGDTVQVTIRWPADRFAGDALHKALDCVTVNGTLAPELSREERAPENDGRFEHGFVIPADLKVGTEICDRGMVSGPLPVGAFSRDKTNDVCFTIASPDAQRTPDALGPPRAPLSQPGVVLDEAPAPAASPLPPPTPEFPGLAGTGSASRFLAAYAGLSLAAGGLSMVFGADRRRRPLRPPSPAERSPDAQP